MLSKVQTSIQRNKGQRKDGAERNQTQPCMKLCQVIDVPWNAVECFQICREPPTLNS